MRQELQVVLQAVRNLSVEDLPTLLGELEQVRCTAIARLSEPTLPALREPGRLLPIEEAADRLSISTDYLYRHADDYRFTRGIDQFIASDSSAEGRRKGKKSPPGIRSR